MRYAYPCLPQPDEPPGSFTITFRDLTEAITCGDSLGEALENAQEVLELALTGRLAGGEDIPEPSNQRPWEELVPLTPAFAAKMALLLAMQKQQIQPEELQHRMGVTQKEIQDLLTPEGISPVNRLTQALQAVGRRFVLEDLPDDAGEHFREPAGPGMMEEAQFIRRLRRYASHRDIQWVLLDEEQDNRTTVRMGTRTAKLPEGDLSQQDLTNILERLDIEAREF